MNHRGTEAQRVLLDSSPQSHEGFALKPIASGVVSSARRKINEVTEKIIGGAIEVHRALGPGLLESAYEECLCYELSQAGLSFERQVSLPVVYKNINLDCGYRIDIVVEESVVVELKASEALLPIHEAQLLTYLRLRNCPVGLLINFNVPVLKQGIKRLVLGNISPQRRRGTEGYLGEEA